MYSGLSSASSMTDTEEEGGVGCCLPQGPHCHRYLLHLPGLPCNENENAENVCPYKDMKIVICFKITPRCFCSV